MTFLKTIIILVLVLCSLGCAGQTFEQLYASAMAGDSVAMVDLAEKYQFGEGVTASEDSAVMWINRAAEKGNAEALYLAGIRKCSQIYSPKEFSKGMELLNKSADLGNAKAMVKLYEIWTDKTFEDESAKYNNPAKGFSYIKRAAEAGDMEAIHITAEAYANGKGVTRSDSAALVLFAFNAEENQYIPSRLRLADLKYEGRGISQPDYWGALELYKGVRYDPIAGTDSKALAEIGVHRVDQVLKRAQVLHMQGHGILPARFFDYRLRE